MPKYYCDYCDTYLTHDSPSVRKTHCQGRKHKDNVKDFYQKWMEDQAQQLIDATTAAFKAGKITTNPFANGTNTAVPPPSNYRMARPGPGGPYTSMMCPSPMMMRPPGPMPPMMGMPPPMMGPMGPMCPIVGPVPPARPPSLKT